MSRVVSYRLCKTYSKRLDYGNHLTFLFLLDSTISTNAAVDDKQIMNISTNATQLVQLMHESI